MRHPASRFALLVTACGAALATVGNARAEVGAPWCTELGACWELPRPQGNALGAAWGSSDRDVWLVGSAGTIVHFDGAAWSRVASGTTASLRAVWGAAADDVWAVGDAGIRLHFDGRAWSAAGSSGRAGLRAVWGSGPRDVWAAGERGALLHFDGERWSEVASGARELLLGLGGTSARDVYAVGTGGAVLHFDGSSWSRARSVTANALHSVWARAPGDIWVTSGNGDNLHLDGSTWTLVPRGTESRRFDLLAAWSAPAPAPVPAPAPRPAAGVAPAPPTPMVPFAIDRCGGLYRGGLVAGRAALPSALDLSLLPAPAADHDALVGLPSSVVGVTVAQACAADRAAPPVLHAIALRGDVGFAAGDSGALWQWSAGGGWKALRPIVTTSLRGLAVVGPAEAWAVGGSSVLRWDGAAWAEAAAIRGLAAEAVWASAAGELWFAGSAGAVARRDTRGRVAVVPSNTTLPLAAIWGAASGPAAGPVFVAGGEARSGSREPPGVVISCDARRCSRATTAPAPLAAIAGSGPRDVWAAGARGTLLHYDGRRWTPSDSGVTDDLTALWAPAPDEAWAAGKSGTLLRFMAGRWRRVEIGTGNHLYAISGDERVVRVAGMNGTIIAVPRR